MSLAARARNLLELLKQAFVEWDRDNVPRLAAALAYYTVFSLAPLLVIAVALAGLVFGEEAARGEIVRQIQTLIGRHGAEVVEGVVRAASRPSSGVMATVVGLVALLIGATGAFAQVQGGLNTVWEVAPRPGRLLRGLVRTRVLSFAMILVVGFLLLVSLVVTAGLEAFGGYLEARLPAPPVPFGVLNGLLSFTIVTLLFATIYRVLPDARIAWRDVWLGAAVTSTLFAAGKHLIGLYLGHSSVGSAYGAAGTLAILLIWVYYSANIFYFGAEITQLHARAGGRAIRPSPWATRMVRVRVQADDALEAREKAAAAVAARLQQDEPLPLDAAAARDRGRPPAATSMRGPDRQAAAARGEALVPVTAELVPHESRALVAVLGPEPSRLERVAGILAGLLVGLAVGALSLKRRVDVSGGPER